MMTLPHPALVLIVAASFAALTRGRARQVGLVLATLAALIAAFALPDGDRGVVELTGQGLVLLRVDPVSRFFGLIFTAIAFIGTIYGLHIDRGGEHFTKLIYAAGALTVIYAGDWLTVFAGWELMAVTSLALIWFGGTTRARMAGLRYIYVHLTGGSLLFSGIALLWASGGELTLTRLSPGTGLASGLILAGVLVNAAVPPVHAWLTDAYPEASVTGTVFLSAFTTKTAVYLLIRVFPGTEALMWAGAIMAVYGALFAVLENDIRRLLSYHIISQVGYMVAGVGMGTALAVNGAAAHAFSHILYKALLLMGAGAVLQATGRNKLTELGGLARSMPGVTMLYLIGACSISGVPLFSGFVSKSLIVSAASEHGHVMVEWLLIVASVGTFLHTGLKLPYFTFFGPDRGLKPTRLPRNMVVAMGLAAAACIGIGVIPDWLYARLPVPEVSYAPYTFDHVLSTLQLLIGTGVAFWLARQSLGGTPTVTLDTDRLWRRPVWMLVTCLVNGVAMAGQRWRFGTLAVAERVAVTLQSPFHVARPGMLPYDADRHRLPIGANVVWIAVGFVALMLAIWQLTGV
ncbi:MAG: Na(+)/H(+) antiporter subunit D [Vicinamibacterales bacterium]|jgi:multicomponent Na+:H+ antiporter subunit D|nr:Na(+)/H(+) antiporter subunit D [Acidobacteriota bacterium]MDP7210422.1 Na(+)/H(+) antiporter subunit D [Vicinamibacterales bacterium]HJO16882.1 Na(+)/H(+) antiporter subunit D [Vicinamibacterales bacterium]|tara:strand:- start:400 stop:2121 length:1722 start_codon:yes stop_codon:yes gene_type:complete